MKAPLGRGLRANKALRVRPPSTVRTPRLDSAARESPTGVAIQPISPRSCWISRGLTRQWSKPASRALA